MSVKIRLYPVESIEEPLLIERDCLADWLRDIGGLPLGFRIYDGSVCIRNDITDGLYKKPELLLNDSGEYDVCKTAGDPVTWAAVIIATVSAVYTYTMMKNMNVSTNDANQSQSSATNSFSDRQNEARIGERIDDIFGTVAGHIPPLWQVPYSRYDNNVEYEHFYLCIGRGKYQFNNPPRDGETSVTRIPGSKVNVWGPNKSPNSGHAPDYSWGGLISRSLYTVDKSGEIDNSELLPPNDLAVESVTWYLTGVNSTTGVLSISASEGVDLNDYFSVNQVIDLYGMTYFGGYALTQYYRGTVGSPITQGIYTYSTKQNLGDTFSYTVIAVTETSITVALPQTDAGLLAAWAAMSSYSPPSGMYSLNDGSVKYTSNSLIASYTWYTSSALTTTVVYNGYNTYKLAAGPDFSGYVGPYEIPEGTEICQFNFVSNNGFYKYVNSVLSGITAKIQLRFEELDESGIKTGNYHDSPQYTYATNSSSPRKQAAITVDYDYSSLGYRYGQVSAIRLTDRDMSGSVSNVDAINWKDLYFVNSVDKTEFGDVTTAQVCIRANPTSLGIKERKLGFDVTRLITPYLDGGSSESLASDYFDDILVHMALDPYIGRMTINDIDAQGMREAREAIIDYFGHEDTVKVGYDFDTTKTRFQDSFNLIANAANCTAYTQGAVYRVFANLPQTESSKQFTHRNKIPNTEKRTRLFNQESSYDGVELTYRRNKTWANETISLSVDGISSMNPYKITLDGCITERAAKIRAYRELNIIKYQRNKIEFKADGIGAMTIPGERVDVADNTRISKRENNTNDYYVFDGEVMAVSGLAITLSQPVDFQDGVTYSIRFTKRNGDISEAITCTATSSKYKVLLSSAPTESIYTGYREDRTTYVISPDSGYSSLAMLIQDVEATDSGKLEIRKLTGANYDPRYYQQDLLL